MKNIFILILCFLLLFVAFHPGTLESDSFIFDYDGHRQIFFNDPVDGYRLTDLWISSDGTVYICKRNFRDLLSLDDWEVLDQSELQTPGLSYVLSLERSQVDNKIEFWYQTNPPSDSWDQGAKAAHEGDLWYVFGDEVAFQYVNGEWIDVQNADLFADPDFVSFDDVFEFGYAITIGFFEMLVSIFKGYDVFIEAFEKWKTALIGDLTIADFLIGLVKGAFSFLDTLTDELPVIREIKAVIANVFDPIAEIVNDVIDWCKDFFD